MKKKMHVRNIERAITEPKLNISSDMAYIIAACANPAAVAYYLRANPSLADRIAKQKATRAAREIRRIDEAFDCVGMRLTRQSPRPSPATFKNYDSYIDALNEWRLAEVMR